MNSQLPLRVFAYHEAGHVVVDVANGITVEGALIDETRGGRTDVAGFDEMEVDHLSSDECRALLGPAMVALLAGPYAEERLVGEFDPEIAAADLQSVAQLGFHCVNRLSEWPEYEAQLSAEARVAVDQHWDSIHEFATELLARRAMRGEEIRDWFATHPIRPNS